MSNFLLTPQERDRFVQWLESNAASNEGVADQMEKMGGPIMATVAQKNRHEAGAMRVVSRILQSTEFQEIR